MHPMTQSSNLSSILVALDSTDKIRCRNLVERLAPLGLGFKIGKEFFTALGPQGVQEVLRGAPFFLDLKFHDIPNTVAGALRSSHAESRLLVRDLLRNLEVEHGAASAEEPDFALPPDFLAVPPPRTFRAAEEV